MKKKRLSKVTKIVSLSMCAGNDCVFIRLVQRQNSFYAFASGSGSTGLGKD